MLPVMLEKSGRNSASTLPGPDHMMRKHHMAKRSLPSPLLMRKLFAYSPVTGELEWLERDPELFADGARPADWRARNWNAKNAGRLAFTANDGHGYKTGAVFGQLFKAHHAI